MTPDQPHPEDERLGDRPEFDDWVDEVRTALEARRRAASHRAAGEAKSVDSPPGAPPEHARRWRRFLYLPFS